MNFVLYKSLKMKRRDVLKKIVVLITVLLLFTTGTESCSKPDNGGPSDVNFTLDLTNGANAMLNIVGGFIITNGVIVIKSAPNVYYALASTCTYQVCTVNYDPGAIRIVCPCHGDTYNPATGSVISGPATKALARYTVTQSGNILTIRS